MKRKYASHLAQRSCVSPWRAPLIRFVGALALLALLAESVGGQKRLSAAEAKNHLGETATVCGKVASTKYAASTRGQPTFLNLDKPYPDQIFTVLIWGNHRSKFGRPEVDYKDKQICVSGRILNYRGVPEIVADDPGQIHSE